EADTEAAGAGITGIAGHGPKFRELKQEETRLQIAESLMEKLLGDAKDELARRIEERDALSAQAEELEVRILGHRTEIDTAKRRLAMLQAGPGADSGLLERGAEEVAALSEAKAAFITAPTVEGL